MAVIAAKAMPSATINELLWEMPYNMLGFLVMQSLRLAGVEGIGRPEKSDKLWEAWINERKE